MILTKEASRHIDVLLRSMDILELFLDNEKLQLKDIFALTGLPKNRITRICGTLAARGFLLYDADTLMYSLGPLLSFLGKRYDEANSYIDVIQRALNELSRHTGETSHFCVRSGCDRLCLAIADGTKAIRFTISPGAKAPLSTSASGKVLLAFLPEPEREELLVQLPMTARTENSVTNLDVLREQLTQIRQKGYAVSRSENYHSAGGIAAPVFNRRRDVLGSVNLGGLAEDFENGKSENLLPALRQTADQLSTQLGFLKPGNLI